jgi:hypothetical protein
MLSLSHPFTSGGKLGRIDTLSLILEDKGSNALDCGVLPDSHAGFVGKLQHLDG